MTKDFAHKCAIEDLDRYHCEAYVIIHYDFSSAFMRAVMGKNYSSECDYDYILFASTDDLKTYYSGQYASDYLDRSVIRCYGESITEVYSKTKLLIM